MPFLQINEMNLAPTPPRAVAQGAGEVCALAISAVAIFVDASTLPPPPAPSQADASKLPGQQLGIIGKYVTIEVDVGADVGIVFGPTLASVNTTPPALATVGTLTAQAYTPVAGVCWRLKATDPPLRVYCQPGEDLFIGLVGSAAGVVRMYQSSAVGV